MENCIFLFQPQTLRDAIPGESRTAPRPRPTAVKKVTAIASRRNSRRKPIRPARAAARPGGTGFRHKVSSGGNASSHSREAACDAGSGSAKVALRSNRGSNSAQANTHDWGVTVTDRRFARRARPTGCAIVHLREHALERLLQKAPVIVVRGDNREFHCSGAPADTGDSSAPQGMGFPSSSRWAAKAIRWASKASKRCSTDIS